MRQIETQSLFDYSVECVQYFQFVYVLLYYFSISLSRVVEADIAAAVVLISMGALLGRTTPIQLLLMALIEIVVYASNEYFQLELLKVMNRIVGRIFPRLDFIHSKLFI